MEVGLFPSLASLDWCMGSIGRSQEGPGQIPNQTTNIIGTFSSAGRIVRYFDNYGEEQDINPVLRRVYGA